MIYVFRPLLPVQPVELRCRPHVPHVPHVPRSSGTVENWATPSTFGALDGPTQVDQTGLLRPAATEVAARAMARSGVRPGCPGHVTSTFATPEVLLVLFGDVWFAGREWTS